jgi:hypothetical protein
VTGFQSQQEVQPVGEGADANRLGIEASTQGDQVALHDGRGVRWDERNAAQGGPHEVAVQAVRGATRDDVD